MVAESEIPDDITDYARRKLDRALRLFGDEPANQYRPLEPVLRVVRESLQDSANLPVELFDACASSSRMAANFVRNDVIPRPEQDATINEFLTIIRETGADILANDPKTQQVLTRRNAILGNEVLVDNADLIRAVAAELAAVSEGALPRLVLRDAALATDPAAGADDRHESSFRLSGRMVRYAVIGTTAAVAAGGAAIKNSKEIYWLGDKIYQSPQFQAALEVVMRWLGFI